MLRLVKHSSEQWEDEYIDFYDSVLPHAGNPRDKQLLAASIIPRWDLATLNNDDLLVEEVGTVPHRVRRYCLASVLLPVEEPVVW